MRAMGNEKVRVLLIEDTTANAGLLVDELRKSGLDPLWHRIDNEEEFLAQLKPTPDIILSEYRTQNFSALRALELLKQKGLDIPLVIVTSNISKAAALDSYKQGAEAYILKDCLSSLGVVVERALGQKKLREEKNAAIMALEESEKLFRATAEAAPDAIICIEEPDGIYFWNRRAEEMLGYSSSEVMGKALHPFVVPERYYERAVKGVHEFFRTGRGPNIGKIVEFEAKRKDNSEFPIELSISSIKVDGKWKAVGFIRDITERKRAEEERLKIQKLEALSLLAGGIAHDFNNMLTTILGNAESADQEKDPAEVHKKLIEAERVILRAKNLSQQLMTFAKGGTINKKTLSVSALIEEAVFTSIKAENIKYDLICPEQTWPIDADEVEMSQVLSNIILNAEQAMPNGGRIEVKCSNESLGKGNPFQLEEGRYVKVSIKDTGHGIPKEDLKRLFEPYFTTKQRGKGLGLAIAYSIIRSHAGFITVESKVNVGTTFYIYLPAVNTFTSRM
ncbi:MAG: hypothetical protein A3I81_08505 [Deltaproteobacteria bacterium RIFCSPLOWO2_02_FULL_55_12]|nr:MAG: hypothetical protein A3I81_08505 [Deltaproteobacteria bacterium RIFCSPLOWO2_02_FULL_55_12]